MGLWERCVCIFPKPCIYVNCSVLGEGFSRGGLQRWPPWGGHGWFQQTHGADACTAAQGTAQGDWFGGLFSNVTLACEKFRNFLLEGNCLTSKGQS